MRLSPSVDEILDSVVQEEIGLDPDEVVIVKGKRVDRSAKEIFDNAGGSTQEAAREINRIMKFGDNDSIRLKAAETILKVQGVHQELEKELSDNSPKVEINIISAQNVNLVQNLLLPND